MKRCFKRTSQIAPIIFPFRFLVLFLFSFFFIWGGGGGEGKDGFKTSDFNDKTGKKKPYLVQTFDTKVVFAGR